MVREDRRRAIVALVRHHWLTRHYGPTVRELATALGYPISSVYYHLIRAAEDGELTRESRKSRTWRLP